MKINMCPCFDIFPLYSCAKKFARTVVERVFENANIISEATKNIFYAQKVDTQKVDTQKADNQEDDIGLSELELKKITWISGNTSVALPGILRVATYLETPALVPSYFLPAFRIAPLGGELLLGSGPVLSNGHPAICGVPLETLCSASQALSYAELEPTGLQEPLFQKIRKLNVEESNIYHLRRFVLQGILLDQFSEDEKIKIQNSIHNKWIPGCREDVKDISDKNGNEELEKGEQIFANEDEKTNYQKLQDVIEYFNETKPLSTQEQSFLSDSFPLVWASTTLKDDLESTGVVGKPKELRLYRPAYLGKDLQYVFVGGTAEQKKMVSSALKDYNIKVLKLDVLEKYIKTLPYY